MLRYWSLVNTSLHTYKHSANIPTMDLSFVNTFGSYSFLENLASKLTVNCGLSYSASKQRTSSSRLFKGTGASVGLVNW